MYLQITVIPMKNPHYAAFIHKLPQLNEILVAQSKYGYIAIQV